MNFKKNFITRVWIIFLKITFFKNSIIVSIHKVHSCNYYLNKWNIVLLNFGIKTSCMINKLQRVCSEHVKEDKI